MVATFVVSNTLIHLTPIFVQLAIDFMPTEVFGQPFNSCNSILK